MSVTERSVLRRSAAARSRRRVRRYWCGVSPNARRNSRLKCAGERYAARASAGTSRGSRKRASTVSLARNRCRSGGTVIDATYVRRALPRELSGMHDRCTSREDNQGGMENVNARMEKAILAGGCFWGMQDLIRRRPGVLSTRVGYTGGDVPNATYRNHEGHAEAIEITFDPEQISYRDLLEFFFQIHDPTTLNRQGNDVGTSYRSAIFYVDDEQKRVAEDTIADVDASGLWPGKVVTEVTKAGPFWEAEPEHQDYLERYPHGYTCHFIRPNWKLPHRAA